LENLERGCHPEDLAKILLQEGLIELKADKILLKMSKIIMGQQAQKQSFTDH
jgi:hypothetical protein